MNHHSTLKSQSQSLICEQIELKSKGKIDFNRVIPYHFGLCENQFIQISFQLGQGKLK